MEIEATLNPCKRRRLTEPVTGTGSRISHSEGGEGENDGSFLPEWFLIEVLCRLPMDALFRFKCISRQCLSFISDPSFLLLYRSRASALGTPRCKLAFLPPRLLSQLPKMSSHLPEPAHDQNDGISPELYFLSLPTFQGATQEEKRYYIRAAHKGFLLYGLHQNCRGNSRNYSAEYYICNPLTKQWFALPTHHFFIRINVGFIAQVEDGNLTSFKVILLHCPPTKRNFLEFQVFSSETGKWKDFVVWCESRVLVSYSRRPVVLNNILHWIDCELGIVAYDPFHCPDKVRIIEFPEDAGKWPNTASYGASTTKCGVFQGRLKYFEIIESNPLESSTLKIWELQDYSSDHWRTQHSTTVGDVVGPFKMDQHMFPCTTLMSFHPWDPDVVYMYWGGGGGLVTYNMYTRKVEPLGLKSKYDIDCWRTMDLSHCFVLGPVGIPTSPGIGPDDHVSLLI